MSEDELKEFKRLLYAGEVSFVYNKKDGSERPAKGTMNPDILREKGVPVPEENGEQSVQQQEPKFKKARKLPADSVLYFDLEADGFRSFKKDNLVSFEK